MIDQDTLKTILIAATTAIATKSAEEGPAKTLVDIWNIALGHFFSCASEKVKIFWTDFFIPDLTQKISSIPEENLQEPKMSIVGPSLEASKYYFEEEEIRKMFANLIASSMNSTYNGLVQHSFVEIIKQLSPHDAKLFSYFNKEEAYISLIILNSEGYTTIKDKLYFKPNFPNYQLNEISIDNLIRLGLISVAENTYLTDDICYKHYSEIAPVYNSLPSFNNSKFCLKKCFTITSFGEAFKNVCIKDPL